MIFKTAFLYVTYRLLGVVKLSCFYDFSCTLITSENLTLMFTNTFIFFLFTDLCIFFFFFFGFSETKQIAVVRQNHVDFFNWKVQNFRLIITTVTVWRFLKAERSYCRYFTHQLNRKKISNDFIFYFLEPSKYFVNF